MQPFPKKRYGVILADPPWHFKAGVGPKHARQHYPTMSRADILAMPVQQIAEENSVLVLWATQAQLPDALEVMASWGFKYKTFGPWLKMTKNSIAFGTGYILRSSAEAFLIGTRGRMPVTSRSERNSIIAPLREHSRKPDEIYDLTESLWPSATKIELFARQRRKGWDAWGNQTTKFKEPPLYTGGQLNTCCAD